jgi:hypothetical protein
MRIFAKAERSNQVYPAYRVSTIDFEWRPFWPL